MQTLTKRQILAHHRFLQSISFRKCSDKPKILKPRRSPTNYDESKSAQLSSTKNAPSKVYRSNAGTSRSIPIYNKVTNLNNQELEDMITSQDTTPFTHLQNKKLSKKMKQKLRKKTDKKQLDISANFLQSNEENIEYDDSIHGIINMFDDNQQQEIEMDDKEYWYNNPEHIHEVEQFLRQKKLPFNEHDDESSYFTEDIMNKRDMIQMNKKPLTKRMQIKLNRKLKQKGINIENLNNNELIQRNNSIILKSNQEENNDKLMIKQKNENEDISLKVWDPTRKEFTHSPTPHIPKTETSLKLRKNKKLAAKWRKHERRHKNKNKDKDNMDITDLPITNISPYWLFYDEIDPIILDQLSHRLPLFSRYFSKTPQGLYKMNDKLRKILQRLLVNEYWPTGWAEKKDEQIFGQRLFNAVHVKYDRRKVLRYIANEFPLSLSVNYRILKELKHRMPDFKPKGMIDFGQGPGCSTIAAIEVFNDSLKLCYAIEPSSIMREFGSKILEKYNTDNRHLAYLDSLDIKNAKEQPLIICSFVLSEINGGYDELCKYLDKLWISTRKILIFIESGTIDGYNLINFARSYLLSKYPPSDDINIPGTYTISPCPHDKGCPLSSNNICRFIQRIDRHQVPTRCHFKSEKKRTKYILNKNIKREKKGKKINLRDKRKIDEIQFPYSYCILGKGVSPRLISPESNIFSKHFPHYFMNEKQAEQAAYFWPRIISPPKYRHNNLYLHLCLPDRPNHADIDINKLQQQQQQLQLQQNNNNALMTIDNEQNQSDIMKVFDDRLKEQQLILPNSRVSGQLKLDYRKSAKPHVNIMDYEGIDESEYGYLEKWLIAKSDNKLQMYLDARRAKWGELWPWQSPLISRCSSLRLNASTQYSDKQLKRYSRPRFREYFAKFRKDCGHFVYDNNNIDLMSNHNDINLRSQQAEQL